MEQLQLIPKPAGGHSLSTDVLAALRPMRGLTFRRGDMEANVHDVHNGSVYWGVYAIGARNPTLLIRASEEDWESIAIRALTEGAEAFCLVDANASYA